MADIKAIAKALVNLTLLDAQALKATLKQEYGIEFAIYGGDLVIKTDPQPNQEKREFDVVLVTDGGRKLDVIKVVRAVTGVGLKEAKDLVDNAPSLLLDSVSKATAESVKSQLEEAGAKAELK